METRSEKFLQEVRENLTSCILPYWLKLKDPRGGFYGEVAPDGTVLYDAPRGVILNARIIWSFAAAYQALPETPYLVAAVHARDYFLDHFCDHKYGGVYWSVDAAGERLDTKKQLYAQGFAIYGLSELYKVTGDDEVLKNAINLYRVVETYFADKENGGYIEALARDFSPLEDMSLSAHDINADKTMNSHLHVLEAYANLYQVWPDEELKEAVQKLLDLVGTRIMGADGHLQLYFRKDWSVMPGGVSYGHDIETSWLALECADALKDIDVVNRVRPWALSMGKAGNEGLLPDGSMRYEKLLDGKYDDSRQWWVQAETVVGNLWLWKYHADPQGADRALAAWNYIRENLVDEKDGEWWWAVLEDGSRDLSQPKVGFWKCPYHNTRMCLQVLSLF
ncbi:MAG: N-acyl-D-glucosamine 2-epimerase [Bacteroidales bacterium]|jgi:mannobiose 2-epimerase|nr:N-acyl-D-glucosamine 2-epimerase [Bacteroidales bacterium]